MLNSIKNPIYRMPAEWEKQKSTWVAWPHNKADWPKKFKFIPNIYAKIITQISKVQKINILVQNKREEDEIKLILKKYPINSRNIYFRICRTDRTWVRDSFPIFVKNKLKRKILLDWKFNGWAKYKNFKYDNNICSEIKKNLDLKVVQPSIKNRKIVLEGGSIDVNGKGALITTLECLQSKVQERNPGLKKKDYENLFKKFLGVSKVIWLNKGISGDDTHGHVDDIARFVDKKKIFIAFENNKKDTNYKALKENYRIINEFNKKKEFKIIKIPMPRAKYIHGVRVPASYLNFYIANKLVLVPIFNDNKDKNVIKIFKKHFKKRKIIPVDCSILIWGFGAVHCMTQQEPI